MKIIEAGLFDYGKLDHVIVENRKNFDNPIFTKGDPQKYTSWFGLKKPFKFLMIMIRPGSHLFFVMDDKNVAGTAIILRNNFIEGFMINREYQRKGMGKELMQFLFGFVKKRSGDISVQVEEQNGEAKKFYEACGFKDRSRILSKKLR